MKKKIMLIGAAVLDVLARPVEPKVFETGSLGTEEIRMSVGGDALNEATVLGKLGAEPYLCTLLGEDEAGRLISQHCGKYGIDLKYTFTDKDLITGINVVLVQKDGARNFLTNPGGTLRRLELRHIPEELPEDVGIVSMASIFVSPELGIPQMSTLFSRIKEQGKILCADMTKRKNGETLDQMEKVLSYVDYLFPNQEEAELLTGEKEPEGQAQAFLNCGVKHVLIKCGARGCYILNSQFGEWIPGAKGVNCIDTTGAGDCFAGGLLYALSREWDFRECARFANACGSLAVECTGASEGIRDLAQVEERLKIL